MPAKIACPKCATQYQLPESAIGKAVKCKNCGTKFKAQVPDAASNQMIVKQAGGVTTVQSNQPSQSELAKFGIDGPIKRQADIFAAPPLNPRSQGLASVIEDPGFGNLEDIQTAASDSGELSLAGDDNAGMDAILNNPYMRPTKTRKKVESPEDHIVGAKKKKKRKIHPAIKQSLDQATMTLLIIGVLTISAFGFMFYNADHDAKAMANNANVEAAGFDPDEVAADASAALKAVYGTGIGIGTIFCIFAFGVQIFPITCSILALVFYVGLEAVFLLVAPMGLVSITGWLRRIVICSALGKAFMDALNARSYTQMMEARGR